MKRALFNTKPKEVIISVEEINDRSFVGIETTKNKRMYLMQTKEGYFAVQPFQQSLIHSWAEVSKLEYLRRFTPEPKVYVFETLEGLINWTIRDTADETI